MCRRAKQEEASGKDGPPARAVHLAVGPVGLAPLLARRPGLRRVPRGAAGALVLLSLLNVLWESRGDVPAHA